MRSPLTLSLSLRVFLVAGNDTTRSAGEEKTREEHLGEWSRSQKTDDLWPPPHVDYATRVSKLLISQCAARCTVIRAGFIVHDSNYEISCSFHSQPPRICASESNVPGVDEHAIRATVANHDREHYLFDERRREEAAQSHSNL